MIFKLLERKSRAPNAYLSTRPFETGLSQFIGFCGQIESLELDGKGAADVLFAKESAAHTATRKCPCIDGAGIWQLTGRGPREQFSTEVHWTATPSASAPWRARRRTTSQASITKVKTLSKRPSLDLQSSQNSWLTGTRCRTPPSRRPSLWTVRFMKSVALSR